MTHTTLGLMWLLKMTILRLLGSSDDKEKRGVARPEGPPLRGFRYPVSGRGSRGSRPSRVSGQRPETSSVQRIRRLKKPWRIQVEKIKTKQICYHRLNRWWANLYSSVQWTWHRINRRWVFYTRRCIDLEYTRLEFYTGWTDAKEIAYVGALTDENRGNSIHT